MDDFVVGQRQHEILGERVDHPERHLVVVPAPVHRILGHVLQRVVHPAHVPFEAEAQAPCVHRSARRAGQAVDSSAMVMAPGKALVDDAY